MKGLQSDILNTGAEKAPNLLNISILHPPTQLVDFQLFKQVFNKAFTLLCFGVSIALEALALFDYGLRAKNVIINFKSNIL